MPAAALAGATPGLTVVDVFRGTQPGQFGWLTWAGSPSEPTLVASLTPPGNSYTYVNPDDSTDSQLNIGDWVRGKSGVSNSRGVRDALDALKTSDITVPVWDQTRGQGGQAAYRVSAFARIRILSYQLPQQNRITATFLGWVDCDAVNQPPVVSAGPDLNLVLPAAVTLNGSVSDDGLPAGGSLSQTWTVVSGPGSVTFANASAAVTTATFSDEGTYVLRLTASDSALTASDDSVVVVDRPNHPPVANSQSLTNNEDIVFNVVLQGSDPDSDPITFTVVDLPQHGTLSGIPPNLAYTPAQDYHGTDSFTFRANDGQLDSGVATISIIILPVNDAPTADSQSLSTPEDTALSLQLSGADAEDSPLTFAILSAPTHGTLAGSGSSYIYQPFTNFHGTDAFTYVSSDGTLTSTVATVTIAVSWVDDAPIVYAGLDQLINLPTNSVTLAGTINDAEFIEGQTVITNWSKLSGPGTATFSDSASITSTVTFSQNGIYVLALSADDGFFLETDEVVIVVNDPPAVGAGPSLTNTLPASLTLMGTVSDDGLPTNGVLTIEWSQVTGPGTAYFADVHQTNSTVQFSESGLYVLRLSASDGAATSTNDVLVLANRAPLVDAGSDRTNNALTLTLSGSVADDGIPVGVGAAPLWTVVSGPGSVTFDNAGNPGTSATFSQSGVYVLRLSASDSIASVSDEVTLYINAAPIVNAGANQTIFINGAAQLNGTVIDDGIPPGVLLDIHWSVVSGPGVAAFDDPMAVVTAAAFNQPGTYVLRLTASDSLLSASSEVTITVRPINYPPAVYAGTNQLVRFPDIAHLQGIVTDDGEPAGSTVSVIWNKVMGPGTVTFGNASAVITTATFGAPGIYVLSLVASDTELTATNFVAVTVNAAPVVDAGPDQITTVSNSMTLAGVVTDDGLPFASTNIAWTKISGPGLVLFSQPASAVTPVTFGAAGNYVLQLSASDGHLVTSDQVTVTVRVAGQNLPPAVFAGTNQYVALTNRANLQGSVADDGLPVGATVVATWSKVSGPGNVSFAGTNDPVTTATFSAAGDYVLRLTATDMEFTVIDDIAISIYPDNQPPVVSAGLDQSIVTGPATLSGTITDDGRPVGAALTHVWSNVSGPGSVSIANSNSAVTTVSFSEAGVYVFRFTGSDTEFSASDDVTVAVTGNQPPIVDAGGDQVLDLFLASGATNSTTVYPANPDQFRFQASQPGLTGVWGNIGVDTRVFQSGLSWSGSDLYVGGGFLNANGVEVRNIARWNGCSYFPLYDPRPSIPGNPGSAPIGFVANPSGTTVAPIAARGSEVFVAGGFLQDLDRNGFLDFTARWTGTGWESWQFKIASSSVARFAMLAIADAVYFGGQFKFQTNTAVGAPISFNLAKWDGTNWVALGQGLKDINDTDANNSIQYAFVNAIAVATNGDVYAGGRFITQTPTGFATNIARWDGTQWRPIPGFNYSDGSRVTALAFAASGELYVGGDFTTLGGVTVNRVARWNGTAWSALGTGINATVEALAFRNSDLYAGGRFTQAGSITANRLARWTGSTWLAVSNGFNNDVAALATTPSGIYVGGSFSTAGGQIANRIVKWGGNELPTLNGPAPITVANAPSGGASVPVTVTVQHPCASALTLSWNVDGGASEQTDIVPAGTASTNFPVTFTHLYAPGVHSLVVTLSDGVSGPVVFSTTVTVLTLAITTLAGTISDDGLPVGTLIGTWDLLGGPTSVTFSQPSTTNAPPATGASFTQVGTYVLRLTGSDTVLSATDTLTVNVRAAGNANLPPTVNAGPDLFIAIDESAVLNGVVTDDGLPTATVAVTWTQIAGPGTTTFSPPAANIATVSASFSAPGAYVLRLTGHDSEQSSFDDVTVTVSGVTNAPPLVNAGPDQTIGLSDSAALAGVATDDGLPFGTLIASWSQVSGPGATLLRVINGVTYAQFGEVGSYVLRLTANDGRVSAFDDLTITVLTNTPGPVVQIVSPIDSAIITAPTIVTGTVQSAILQSWTLHYRLKPGEDEALNKPQSPALAWISLVSANTPVNSQPLATFDPTLLLNGIYELQLTATDQVGRTVATEPVTLIVDRNMKVGHFTLSFNDLTIPVAGIPIQVTRTYDSRDKRVGDFGVGWTLDLKNIRVQKNRHLGRAWDQSTTGGLFPTYCIDTLKPRVVTVTFPDGRVYKFQAAPVNINTGSSCQALVPLVYPTMLFTPIGGNTFGTLVPLYEQDGAIIPDDQLVFGAFEGIPGRGDFISYERLLNPPPGAADNLLFNPDLFEFTSQEGFRYILSETNGLRSVTDPNGNTLTITTNGITWTNATGGAAVTVAFQRDALGRITNIVDALGHAMTYSYNTNGDLITFTDRAGNTNGFTYDGRHQLLTLADARGLEAVRNVYDAAGRIVRHIDANGQQIAYAHDVNNRLEIITNRLGFVTLSEYDANGNVVRTVAPDGGVISMSYDPNDNLLSTVDPLGRTNSYTYDAKDNRTSATDPLGNTTTLTYNDLRRVTSATDARGNSITNRYDAKGNLLSMRDPLGRVISFGYSDQGLPLAMTNTLGHVMTYAYDAQGRLTNEVDVAGHATRYVRDLAGNLLHQITTRTRVDNSIETLTVSMQYDGLNRLTNTIFPDLSSARTVYNAIGKPAATIDQLGRQTLMVYDELGRLTRTIYPDGNFDSTAYDIEGRRIASTNRLGQVTQYGYDNVGRLLRMVASDGTTTTNYFDVAGQLIAATDARGFNTFYGYDDAGRSVAVTNALLQVNRSVYDQAGNLVAAIDALGRTNRFFYDALNRRTNTVFADGSVASTFFDELGRRVAEVDQNTNTTRFGYDNLGRLRFVTNSLGKVTEYRYNELGQQTHQIDANNHATTFDYDKLGRRVLRTLPGGQFETYGYNLAGQMTGKQDFNGRFTEYRYDVMSRLEQKIPDPITGEPTVNFAYNVLGQRTNMVDASGSTRYAYDVRNRLVEKVKTWAAVGLSVAINYAYDAAGNLTNVASSSPNGTAVGYQYDALSRLSAVNDARLGQTSYAYDDVGNLQGYALPNGVANLYNYDVLNRLTNLTAAVGSVGVAQYTYGLSPVGHRLTAAETVVRAAVPQTINRVFSYDATYRLLGETISGTPGAATAGYSYDDVGNRLSRTTTGFVPGALDNQSFAFDTNDRLNTDTYDANGNTLFGAGFSQTQADRYDFENRLIERRTTIASVSRTVNIAYDGDGQRVSKTVNGATTFYLVDELNPTGYAQVLEELAVVSGQLVPFRLYTQGHDLLSQDQLIDTGTNLVWSASFYGYDGHGSTRYLTDDNGAVTDTYDYDAFGNLIASAGATPNLYLYSGEQFDPDLGLYYLRARYHNAQTGRFWSMDTFEGFGQDPASLHKYTYCGNNPVNCIDPSGRIGIAELKVSMAVGAVIGGAFASLRAGVEGYYQMNLRGVELVEHIAVQGAIGAGIGALGGAVGGAIGTSLAGNSAAAIFTRAFWTAKNGAAFLMGSGLAAYGGYQGGKQAFADIVEAVEGANEGNYAYAAFMVTMAGTELSALNPRKFHLRTRRPIMAWDDVRANTLIDYRTLQSTPRNRYTYVVMEDGSLRVGVNRPRAHPDMAQGKPVQAAGEVVIENGRIVEINNQSGSYAPYGVRAKLAAEQAFDAHGFKEAVGKYFDLPH